MLRKDDSGIKATGARLISFYGLTVNVIRKNITAHDPVEGTVTNTPSIIPMEAVTTKKTKDNFVGALIEQGDRLMAISGELVFDDQVDIDGVIWQVVFLEPKQPANDNIITNVQLRI